MSSRLLVGWAIVTLGFLLVPASLGHVSGPPYSPLTPTLKYYLLPHGVTTPEAPDPSSRGTAIPVPSSAGSLQFLTWNTTVFRAFNFTALSVEGVVRNNGSTPFLFLPASPTNKSFVARLLLNGKSVLEGSADPRNTTLLPGQVERFVVRLSEPKGVNVTRGDVLGIALAFNGLNPTNQLEYVLGNGSNPFFWTSKVRLASFQEVFPQHLGSDVQYGWPSTSIPDPLPGEIAVTIEETADDGISPQTFSGTLGTDGTARIALRLKSLDTQEQGEAHEDGTGGLRNPYGISLRGPSLDVSENLYPGEWVIRRVRISTTGTFAITCTSGCPSTGTNGGVLTIQAPQPPTPPSPTPPPPTPTPPPPTPSPTPSPSPTSSGGIRIPDLSVGLLLLGAFTLGALGSRR